MLKRTVPAIIPTERIERSIHVLRGHRVMLDSDLAALYGVPTKVLNQSVRRNLDRFPDDFAFQLAEQEEISLRSQIVTSKPGRGGRRYRPWVFTEHGVAMLSSVLRSRKAVQVNVQIMRAFVRMRRLLTTPGEIVETVKRLAATVHLHDAQIKSVIQVLEQLITPPRPKTEIGFRPRPPEGPNPS